jgi:hypothetical protein
VGVASIFAGGSVSSLAAAVVAWHRFPTEAGAKLTGGPGVSYSHLALGSVAPLAGALSLIALSYYPLSAPSGDATL